METGQKVTFVTERCVLELRSEGLTVVELAPGVDLHRHVLDATPVKLLVADDLRLTPVRVYSSDAFGLELDRSSQ